MWSSNPNDPFRRISFIENHDELIEEIESGEIDVYSFDCNHVSLLSLAAKFNNIKMMSVILLKEKEIRLKQSNSILSSTKLLIDTPSVGGSYPIHFACIFNSEKAFQFLIDNGDNPNKINPLTDETCGHMLLDMNFTDFDFFNNWMKQVDINTLKIINKKGRSIFHHMCHVGSLDMIKKLVSLNIYDIHFPIIDEYGREFMPIFGALQSKSLDNVKYLLSLDIDCINDKHRIRIIRYSFNTPPILTYLLDYFYGNNAKRKYNINEVNDKGVGYLFSAIGNRKFYIVKLLIEKYNCDIYIEDLNGNSPYQIAVILKLDLIANYLKPLYDEICI